MYLIYAENHDSKICDVVAMLHTHDEAKEKADTLAKVTGHAIYILKYTDKVEVRTVCISLEEIDQTSCLKQDIAKSVKKSELQLAKEQEKAKKLTEKKPEKVTLDLNVAPIVEDKVNELVNNQITLEAQLQDIIDEVEPIQLEEENITHLSLGILTEIEACQTSEELILITKPFQDLYMVNPEYTQAFNDKTYELDLKLLEQFKNEGDNASSTAELINLYHSEKYSVLGMTELKDNFDQMYKDIYNVKWMDNCIEELKRSKSSDHLKTIINAYPKHIIEDSRFKEWVNNRGEYHAAVEGNLSQFKKV